MSPARNLQQALDAAEEMLREYGYYTGTVRWRGDKVELDIATDRAGLNAGVPKIDNAALPAGSPMYYYCRLCGELIAVLDELHNELAPCWCPHCEELVARGLLPRKKGG